MYLLLNFNFNFNFYILTPNKLKKNFKFCLLKKNQKMY